MAVAAMAEDRPEKPGHDAPERPQERFKEPPGEGSFGRAGMAMLIPSVMAAGPFAGWLVGRLIARLTGWGAWIEITFCFLGLVAGARETIRIIRKLD